MTNEKDIREMDEALAACNAVVDADYTTDHKAVAVIARGDDVPGFAITVKEAKAKLKEFNEFVAGAMTEDIDYGKIPGTGTKKVLLKPGAEKLLSFGGFTTTVRFLDKTEDWNKGFFSYTIAVDVVSKRTGLVECTGIGNANSRESKWGYRWVAERDLPRGIDKDDLPSRDSHKDDFVFKFAVEKGETTGQYGKPAAYWQKWRDAIASGEARPAKRKGKGDKEYDGYSMASGGVEFRIPNPDIYDLVNTILKMAKKRALVDGAIQAMRAATDFTQDVEDFAESEPTPVRPEPKAAPAPAPANDWFGDDVPPPDEPELQMNPDGPPPPKSSKVDVASFTSLAQTLKTKMPEGAYATMMKALLRGRGPEALTSDEMAVAINVLNLKLDGLNG